jgi:hypothetical protein
MTRPKKKKENRTPTPTHHPPLSVDNGASCVFSSNPKPVNIRRARASAAYASLCSS